MNRIGYLIISAIISITVISVFSNKQYNTNPEDFALGTQNTAVLGEYRGHPFNSTGINNSNLIVEGYEKSGINGGVVLWLGNSQLHGINDYQLGDLNTPQIMFDAQLANNLYTIVISPPNGNLQEHLLAYEYLKHKLPIKYLILSLVFDDTREDHIRDISKVLDDTLTKNSLSRYKDFNVSYKIEKGNFKSEAIKKTIQEKTEEYINKYLDENFVIWEERATIRTNINKTLYYTRNKIFGINPLTKRRLLYGPYDRNLNALTFLAQETINDNIPCIFYIAPIRQDLEIPYYKNEYQKFKKETLSIAKKNKIKFLDLEKIVPPEYWGYKEISENTVEYDFMHFKEEGHKILVDTLVNYLDW